MKARRSGSVFHLGVHLRYGVLWLCRSLVGISRNLVGSALSYYIIMSQKYLIQDIRCRTVDQERRA